jgi:hypothetical protein
MAKKKPEVDVEKLVAAEAARHAAKDEVARVGSTLYCSTQKLTEMSVSMGDVVIRGRRNPKTGLIMLEVPDPLVDRFERHTLFQMGHVVKATEDIIEADKPEPVADGGAE